MEKKYLIIIAIVVLVVAVVGALFATGFFNNAQTTPFDTEFMSGAFTGNVAQGESNESFMATYHDDANNITYNLTTMDNSSELMELYKFQGVMGPEKRSFNGQEWNIYFGEALPVVNNTTVSNTSKAMGIVICEAHTGHQGYVIYTIFSDLSKVNFTLNTFGDSYVKFIEPLLKSIKLKDTDNIASVSQQFGLSNDEFAQQIELIRQINAGNYSGLEG
ncbi:hypothetical protein [Methanobrevibacter millerae]|uniref:Uncharacterized protein n=1 Tax=Methanobrevibacter millerae TaxID=230361 RepID=A0A1G5V1N4_9EURY|nr:hypothetical protein [Methanobrevibacter millerae]SDA39801.1 hypothetical protein SAMN02910315_00285 [Methanobrevibacter millerae]